MLAGFNPARALKASLVALLGVFVAVTLTLSSPARAARSCPGSDVALQAGRAFLDAAHTRRASDFANALSKYADMHRIALFALGKYRKSLPPGQTAEFVQLTSNYVANTLADFARKFRARGISLIECRGGKVATRLDFGARPAKRATWRIIGGKVVDVNVQNVWLAQLLRDNFVGILQKAGGNFAILMSNIGAAPPRQLGVN